MMVKVSPSLFPGSASVPLAPAIPASYSLGPPLARGRGVLDGAGPGHLRGRRLEFDPVQETPGGSASPQMNSISGVASRQLMGRKIAAKPLARELDPRRRRNRCGREPRPDRPGPPRAGPASRARPG